MASRLKMAGEFAAWAGVVAFLALVLTFFWPLVGLLLAVLVPVGIIASVIRSLVLELRGRRPTYRDGPIGLAHLPRRPERIRHFTTPR